MDSASALPKPGEKLKDRPLVTPVVLPSRGFPYVVDGKAYVPDGRVLISSMTVADEKMYSNKGIDPYDKAALLLHRTCDLVEAKPDDLLLSDQFFLLIKIRALSYGNRYGFQVMCENCDTQFRHELNIETDMPCHVVETWEEPFVVQLPVSGKLVGCRFLRGADQRVIGKQVKQQHLKAVSRQDSPQFGLLLSRSITTIDGDPVDGAGVQLFIDKLAVCDRAAITEEINERSPGFDPEIEVSCPECGFSHRMVVPYGPEFFRATGSA
jgi:hypothetical protein